MDRTEANSGTREVSERLRFDVKGLERWMDDHVPDVAGSAAFVDWPRGAVSWDALVRRGDVTVAGDRAVTRAFPTWNLRPVRRSAGPASID